MVQMVDFKTMCLADSLIISHNPKLGFQITKCSANRLRSSCWCEKSVSNSGKRIDKSPLLFPADQREWVKTQSASQKISVRGRKIRLDEMINSYLWNCCLLLSDSALEISPKCYTRGSIHAPFRSTLPNNGFMRLRKYNRTQPIREKNVCGHQPVSYFQLT